MSIRPVSRWLLATLTIVGLAGRAPAGPTPAQICQAAKNKAAGKYGDCRLKAAARFAISADNAKYTEALASCEAKYQAKWRALEVMAVAKRGVCPSVGDQAAIQEVIDGHTTNIATALGGGVLQNCPADLATCDGGLTTCTSDLGSCNTTLGTTQASLTTCTSDLGSCDTTLGTTQASLTTCTSDLGSCNTTLGTTQASLTTCTSDLGSCNTTLGTTQASLTTCQSGLAICLGGGLQSQRLKTGETLCYDDVGTVIACAGTGQDAELQKGLAGAYTDNGNGTITDTRTGLMWEKLSADGTIHDKDTAYTWLNAFSTKVATLNADSFAGFTDWRVPNVNELQSLVAYGTSYPAIDAAFNTNCAATCTVLTCSCTQSNAYWSSSSYVDIPSNAWAVYFLDGYVVGYLKDNSAYVRAVRGGP
jgi:hypothetical protein